MLRSSKPSSPWPVAPCPPRNDSARSAAVQGLVALGELVEVGVVAGLVCVVDVDVGVELVGLVAGDVAACVLATLLELCEELPHAATANVQARMTAARILMCRVSGEA